MPHDVKTRFIIRAAMTEYMILMIGAVLLYLAVQAWPHATLAIALVGGLALAIACVLNFCLVYRTSSLPTSTLSAQDTPPRDRSL
ncbi:MAG: hypothetical protein KY468_05805 [Armatimonadetes bacterium]|nr:hypothetical protein [Armatimonadota bacterium]